MTTWQCIFLVLIVTVEYKCYQPHYCTPWRWCWWAHGRTAPLSPASPCLCCTETQPAHTRQNMRSFDASIFWVAVRIHFCSVHELTGTASAQLGRTFHEFPKSAASTSIWLLLLNRSLFWMASKFPQRPQTFPLNTHT